VSTRGQPRGARGGKAPAEPPEAARRGRPAAERGEILRVIAEGTAWATGTEFFRSLVRCLATALDTTCAFVTEFTQGNTIVRPLAFWSGGQLIEAGEYPLAGSPCESVLNGEIAAFPSNVSERFPVEREALDSLGAQSYLAIPIKNAAGVVLGHLAAIDKQPRDWSDVDFGILRIFGARAAGELERRWYERELETANANLAQAHHVAEAASRAKSEFLASMSHELRTPLNGILGYAQLFARDPHLDHRHVEAVQGIQRCGEHLLELVNEVLDLARIEAGRLELHPENTDLGALISETADITRVRAAQAGLAFVFETDAVLPQTVRVDRRRLRQILLNLLGNAVKFTREGEVRFQVGSTRAAPDGWRLRFEIRDTGVGIDRDELPRIFEPFHRAPNDRAIEGTGLGLAITRDLVDAMAGRLHVESKRWQGSTFVVEVEVPGGDECRTPAGSDPRLIPSAQESDKAGLTRCSTPITGYRGPRRTLLIADDKLENRIVLRRLLEPMGFTVHEAGNGRETLALAQRTRPDLILLDIVMPELDGFEVTRRLRVDPDLYAVPIIAVSASVFDDTRQTSLQCGCDDFIAKPVELDVVLEKIGRQLELRWIREGEPAEATIGPGGYATSAERPPPRDQILRLIELSRQGDIAELYACLAELESQGTYTRLVTELRELARNFDMRGIRERLQRVGATLQ